jgi:transposase
MSDGTVGLVHRRRRFSREEAKHLVGEYEASGLTRQAFCAGRGLSVAALDKYRRQVSAAAQRTASSEGRLVTVEVMPGISASKVGPALCVELENGRRIGVGSGFDAATLERLLAVLEQA